MKVNGKQTRTIWVKEGEPEVIQMTPARLITDLICERGICEASEESILQLFPEQADEGYVKFTAHLTEADLPAPAELVRLNEVRTELHELGLIGILPDGIGYGNLSVRSAGEETFWIS